MPVCARYHLVAVLRLLLVGYSWSTIDFQNGTGGIPERQGISLGMTYLIWLTLVLSLYAACQWYHRFKSRSEGVIWIYLKATNKA